MRKIELLLEQQKKHRRQGLLRSLGVGLLTLLVLGATAASLLLPAFTLQGESYCGLEEHVHTAECYEQRLICVLEEDAGHHHETACYAQELILLCGQAEDEGHSHSETCYEQQLTQLCGLEECDGHTHGESCYETARELFCPLEENEEHTHNEDCFREIQTLICLLPEREAHYHSEECFVCEAILTCGEAERQPHSHDTECYAQRETLICEQEEREGHTHGETCYSTELICTREEHRHSLACYANPEADLECESGWILSFPAFSEETPRLRRLLGIARSQLGYRESGANFILDENGSVHGYTRYGAWYGLPYGDWCAMFISFCLYYAGIEPGVFPYACETEGWIARLGDYGLYRDRVGSGYVPRPGDLVFLTANSGAHSNHVGLICAVDAENGGFVTIEGNLDDAVAQGEYAMDDPQIVGYGLLPESLREEEAYEQREAQPVEAESPDGEPEEREKPVIMADADPTEEADPAEPNTSGEPAEASTEEQSAYDELPTLKIVNVDANDPDTRLTGAVFQLELEDGGVWTAMGVYPTDEDGCCLLDNLNPGRYRLIETKAPEGYVILGNTVAFTVDDRGNVAAEESALARLLAGVFIIGNRPGAALPETGGVGTASFRLGGALLLLGAPGLACVARKRRKTEHKKGRMQL